MKGRGDDSGFRTNVWLLPDVVNGRIPSVGVPEGAFPCLDFCSNRGDICLHGRYQCKRDEEDEVVTEMGPGSVIGHGHGIKPSANEQKRVNTYKHSSFS